MAKTAAAKPGTPNITDETLSTVGPPVDVEMPQTLDVERKLSLEQHAAQKAAMNEWQRRQHPGKYTQLPNGQIVEVRGSVIHKYPGAKRTMLMARPDLIIATEHRRPDWGEGMPRYQWRCRTDVSTQRRDLETAQLHNRGDIRYVEISEVDRNSPYAMIEEYAVPGPGSFVYVIMDTSILCEILNPNLSYETYKYWEDLALSNVAELPDVVLGYDDTHIGDKATTQISRKDARQGA